MAQNRGRKRRQTGRKGGKAQRKEKGQEDTMKREEEREGWY